MSQGRLYNLLTWGPTITVTALLVITWINLYIIHSSGQVIQIDRNTILSKNIVDIAGITALIIVIIGVIIRIRRRDVAILVQEIMREIKPSQKEFYNLKKLILNLTLFKIIIKFLTLLNYFLFLRSSVVE